MVPAPIITAAVISVLIASNYQTSILLPSGVFGATPVYSNVTDDTGLGTVPSLGPSSDLLYQDVRYRVLDTAERRYLATIKANSTLAPIKKYLVTNGTRSICTAFLVPIAIRRAFPTAYAAQIQAYRNIIGQEIANAQLTYSSQGQAFTDELDFHISWLTMMFDRVWDYPQMTMDAAYSRPNWGAIGPAASKSCVIAINNLKSWSNDCHLSPCIL